MRKFVTAIGVWWVSGFVLMAEPSVRPLGVGLVWEDAKEAFGGFATLNQQVPVKLAVLVDMDGLGIIELNKETSKLESFTDDQGTDLKGEIWAFPTIAEDGKRMRLDINGEAAPSARAGALTAKGALAVVSGSETAAQKSKVVPAKEGEVLELSKDLHFKINKVGKPQWGDDPFMVELEIKRDIPEVAEVVFYDGEGKLVESSKGGSSRMGFMKSVTIQKSYNLKRKVSEFRVEVKVWTDLKETMVPFEVTVGIGGTR